MKAKPSAIKLILLIVLSLSIIANNGCATTTATQYIHSDEIKAFTENPTESKIPLKIGQTIAIYPNKRIRLNSGDFYIVNLVVTDVDSKRVKGNVLITGKEAGELVEVEFQNIDFISIRKAALRTDPDLAEAIAKCILLLPICAEAR